jgi:hypothetical protein
MKRNVNEKKTSGSIIYTFHQIFLDFYFIFEFSVKKLSPRYYLNNLSRFPVVKRLVNGKNRSALIKFT